MTRPSRSIRDRLTLPAYILLFAALVVTMLFCVCLGSVRIPLSDTVTAFMCALRGQPAPSGIARGIILNVRLPRVLLVSLCGAALSLCGAAMQGLLRNPLADGSTMGVSSGAALGAVIAMAFGITLPGYAYGGIMIMSMLFAFGSLMLILTMAFILDRSLSTNSIILIGVIFSMLVSSLISIIITFNSDHTRSLAFWTMGSFSGANFDQVLLMAAALLICGTVIMCHARELNAFAIGEENARHIGVNVKKAKLVILITVSALIGITVSMCGTISFVGLVMPHIARMLVGPNHKKLLPASLFSGAVFLLLADLTARTIASPIELSIGVVTSLVGAVGFVLIFYRSRRKL